MIHIKDKLAILSDGTEVQLVGNPSTNVDTLLRVLDFKIEECANIKERIVLEDIERNEYNDQINTLNKRICYLEAKLAKKNWKNIPLWIKKLFGIHNLSPIV